MKADVEAVFAMVDPDESFVHAVGGDQNAQTFRTDGAFDCPLPMALGTFDLDHFRDVREIFAVHAEFVGEKFPKGLEICGNV